MRSVPSLLTLCLKELKKELVRGNDLVSVVCELLAELIDRFVMQLPPLALHKIHNQFRPFEDQKEHKLSDYRTRKKRKRRRSHQLTGSKYIGRLICKNTILKHLGYEGHTNLPTSDLSRPSYHCDSVNNLVTTQDI
ncbi:Leucine-rich repeat, ribonuclease inhibitor subtype [Quillaja saponaria]|uniref:Leucine-rich repeat, ribonuclease inhibitor subtype n=1 Tax=Quillaja saponaria TaxID=32244 RepID=A0AAD7VIU6_QUISA|nr:Leucine-rich repeat, ribonuclease inhibitor subtype [Quillaja saponaria]